MHTAIFSQNTLLSKILTWFVLVIRIFIYLYFMLSKTRILGLILIGLLLLPVLLAPKQTGSVLGVNENKSQSASTDQKIGQIGGGTLEDTRISGKDSTKPKTLQGKAIWDENAKSAVSTDKFNLGTSIKVTTPSSSMGLVVGDVRVLSLDTLLVLNKETYTKLGGNPASDKSIDVTVTLD
jgi:hypothetical protein